MFVHGPAGEPEFNIRRLRIHRGLIGIGGEPPDIEVGPMVARDAVIACGVLEKPINPSFPSASTRQW